MRKMHFLTALTIVATAASLVAQTSAAPPKASTKTITISGCVGSDSTAANRFTLSDSKDGITYSLSGSNVRAYVGQRVQITGGLESRRLHIVGGLLPSPNVAAQAGAIDPAQAAVANSGGASGVGAALPTLRVARVRSLSGKCPER